MATRKEVIEESFIMRGVNSVLKWVMYVGRLEGTKLY
jgi:hypothetical protein